MYRPVDDFVELGHAGGRRMLRQDGAADSRIVAYLCAGVVYARPGCGAVCDIFSPQTKIGIPCAMTDGVWAWNSSLSYYVERYNLRLPDEFMRHMADHQWTVPRPEVSPVRGRGSRRA